MMEHRCPWDFLAKAALDFCEQRRCGWIVEPANTLSNLPFVLVGIYLVWKFWKQKPLHMFGIAAIAVGLTSGFYHASASRLAEKFDLASMCLLMGAILSFNMNRLGWLQRQGLSWIAFAIGIVAMLSMISIDSITTEIFDALVLLTLLLELGIYLQFKRKKIPVSVQYRFFWLAFLNHSIAFSIWLLDYHGIACEPDSLLQGHALWHILGALTFVLLAQFYRQFYSEPNSF